MELKEIKGKKFYIRENSLDEFVVRENCYSNCKFTKDDIWLDIGGNIGIFPVFYGDKVKKIISFEPDKDNINSFLKNIELNCITNSTLIDKAIVGDDSKEVEFFVNNRKNKGLHSLINIKGSRTKFIVSALNINEAISKFNPTCLKVDIEGGEYDLFLAIKDFIEVKQIIFEYHVRFLKDKNGDKFLQILNHLRNNKFELVSKLETEVIFNRETFIAHFMKI